MNLIRKAVASLLTGALAWATSITVSEPGPITSGEWVQGGGVLVAAVLVWLVPNGGDSALLDRDPSLPQPVTPSPYKSSEKGAVSPVTLLWVAFLVLAILWLLGVQFRVR